MSHLRLTLIFYDSLFTGQHVLPVLETAINCLLLLPPIPSELLDLHFPSSGSTIGFSLCNLDNGLRYLCLYYMVDLERCALCRQVYFFLDPNDVSNSWPWSVSRAGMCASMFGKRVLIGTAGAVEESRTAEKRSLFEALRTREAIVSHGYGSEGSEYFKRALHEMKTPFWISLWLVIFLQCEFSVMLTHEKVRGVSLRPDS